MLIQGSEHRSRINDKTNLFNSKPSIGMYTVASSGGVGPNLNMSKSIEGNQHHTLNDASKSSYPELVSQMKRKDQKSKEFIA